MSDGLTVEQTKQVVARVRYKDWRFTIQDLTHYLDTDPTGDLIPPTWWFDPELRARLVLRIEFDAPDAFGNPAEKRRQIGRPWLLESHSPSELLQTIWLAIMTAEEHEARELFTFEGKHIFGPHRSHLPPSPIAERSGGRVMPTLEQVTRADIRARNEAELEGSGR